MTETALVAKIISTLEKEVGGFWIKIHGSPFQRRGIPDILGCCEGMFFGLEVKLPGGEDTLSKYQEKTIEWINTKGKGRATMVISPKQAVKFVKSYLKK